MPNYIHSAKCYLNSNKKSKQVQVLKGHSLKCSIPTLITSTMPVSTLKQPRIIELPFEIIVLILSSFSEYDMKQISVLSLDQEVWKAMYKTRFTSGKENTLRSNTNSLWKQSYLRKATLRLSAVDDMEIPHMNTEYWEIVKTESSIYGHVARLDFVCWFKMIGNLESVPPGEYKVQWRIRATGRAAWSGAINLRDSLEFIFRALMSLSINEAYEDTTITEDTHDMPYGLYSDPSIIGYDWLVLTLPGRFVIDSKLGFSKVYFSHDDISISWKYKLDFDWVRLVPVSRTKNYADSKLYVKMDNGNHMVYVHDDSILGNIYR
ncbi:hypothetical protein F4703DRAFT_1913375 [Phycomyces blakesleeanus]